MTSPEPQQPQQQTRPPAMAQAEESLFPEAQQTPVEQRAEEAREEKHAGGKVVHLHTAHPRVPIPYVTPGDMFSDLRTAASTATSRLPSPRKLALYGVLGGMTVAGAMAWPIAVAVGAATEVITREQAARQREEHERIERERAESEQARQTAGERIERGSTTRTAMM